MSVRELVVLGSASQVPTRTRNHNGYLLRWDGEGLLFDPGEGTQRQMTFAGVSAASVTRVCLTHAHGDHCLGLPGVVQRMGLDGARGRVPVYYPARAHPQVAALLAATSYVPLVEVDLRPVTPPAQVATAPGWALTTLPLDHRVPTMGYRLQEPAVSGCFRSGCATPGSTARTSAGSPSRGTSTGRADACGWSR